MAALACYHGLLPILIVFSSVEQEKEVSLRFSCVLLIILLAGCSVFTPDPEVPKQANPTGVSGKRNPQAEIAFAKANVLWKGSEICSNPQEAVSYLDEALMLEPEYAEALERRGLALASLGYWDEAFDDLTRAIRLKPDASRYASRGLMLLRQGNIKGAEQDLEKAVSLSRSEHRPYTLRGALYWETGNTQAACVDFETACARGNCEPIALARKKNVCK